MMIALAERQQLLDYFDDAVTNGARRTQTANVIGDYGCAPYSAGGNRPP
ncbi:hypothetical protein [Methylobacter sp.]|nr:hypothetical protein [Methylobacter sp.]